MYKLLNDIKNNIVLQFPCFDLGLFKWTWTWDTIDLAANCY